MKERKGIILAGGTGSRLHPITIGVSKQLLPVYDKPMIYYPLSVLMLSGINEIALITTAHDQDQFKRLLGDGSNWGVQITYIIQEQPEGLTQAYLLAEHFLNGSPSAMVLGDNIFFGHSLTELLSTANAKAEGGTIFGYHVSNPQHYGVVSFDCDGNAETIVEKPQDPISKYAVTGLYFLDESAPEKARKVEKSVRGELEITTLLQMYLDEGTLTVEIMGRGFVWFDAGTHASLLDAGNFVRSVAERQGMQTGCLEEIAYRKNFIDAEMLKKHAERFHKTTYGKYLESLL